MSVSPSPPLPSSLPEPDSIQLSTTLTWRDGEQEKERNKKEIADASEAGTLVDTHTTTTTIAVEKEQTNEHPHSHPPKVPVPAAGTADAMLNFYVISLIYLCFTISDTALRVSILLHVNNLGFTVFQISLMFCSYECCGVFTNLLGGLVASQIGLKYTLLVGLVCQLASVSLLLPFPSSSSFDVFPSLAGQIAYIAFSQCFSGIAKDMVKLSGKSVSKLVVAKEEQSTLFQLVTNITGAKNAVKGFGFFFGTVLLQLLGFQPTLIILLLLLSCLLPLVLLRLGSELGRSSKRIDWASVLNKGFEFNLLCCARLFLFGSRDVWFEVVLPVYFRNILGWNSIAVGSFLAGWIILYGLVQSNTDRLALKPLGCRPPTSRNLWPWALGLGVTSAIVAVAFTSSLPHSGVSVPTAILVVGLASYAVVFAINSSVHSYLVVLLSDHDKVAQDVGFYYMSNALGRLVGILVGGVLYSFYSLSSSSSDPSIEGGRSENEAREQSFAACLWGSVVLTALSTLFAAGITCGPRAEGAGQQDGTKQQLHPADNSNNDNTTATAAKEHRLHGATAAGNNRTSSAASASGSGGGSASSGSDYPHHVSFHIELNGEELSTIPSVNSKSNSRRG